LVGVNAYRNIHVLRMVVRAYKEAYYEDFTGHLNRLDVPSDRLSVFWDLSRKDAGPPQDIDLDNLLKEGRNLIATETVQVMGRSGELELEVVAETRREESQPVVLIEIPYDFYTMLQETDIPDPRIRDIPVVWRVETRRVFQDQLAAGYRVVDFRYLAREGRKRDFYILRRV